MSDLKTAFSHSAIEPFYTGGKVSISSDGLLLATPYGEDVIVTDLESGNRVCRVEGDEEDTITTLEISPNGSFLVVCYRSLQMKTFELPSGRLVRTVKAHESPIIVMTIDDTSSLVATGGAEGAVKVWDLEGGYNTHTLRGHGGIISALKFWGIPESTDWKLASGSDDCKVRVWDLVRSKCICILDGHVSVVRGLDFSLDGQTLISGGRDRVVNVWSLKTRKLVNTIPVLETIETVGFLSPGLWAQGSSGQLVYTGGEQGISKIWDPSNNSLQFSADHTSDDSIVDIIYKPEIALFIEVLSDQTLVQRDIKNEMKVIRRLAGDHGQIIDSVFLGPDDGHLAIATSSAEIRILDLKGSLDCSIILGHKDIVLSLDRSLDGEWLASAGKDNDARLWHIESLQPFSYTSHSIFSGHTGSIGAVALPRSPSSAKIPRFVITGSQDLTVKRWQVSKQPGQHSTALYTRKAHEKDINEIDVSPDDQLFASASQDRTIKIWSVDQGECVGILRGHKRGVWSVRFSGYNKEVASASGDKTVKLWNLNDFSCLRTFEGHTNTVYNVTFISKGLQLVSAGGDGLVKLWDRKTGECNVTLDNHSDRIWTLAVPQDEEVDKRFISGGEDSVITIWTDITEEERLKQNQERTEEIEKEQDLDNYVFNKDWKNAIIMALSLNKPFKLLKLFSEVINGKTLDNGSITGLAEVDQVIGGLTTDQLTILLTRIRDWNTNARVSPIAQVILHTVLCTRTVEELSGVSGISKIVDSLIPYNQRHLNRVDGLIEDSFLIDYTLKEMDKTLLVEE